MARKKRKFIDKKKAITFTLVHRSQKDPLTADENAPKRVLQPVERSDRKDDLEKFGIFFDDDYDYMQHLKETTTGTDLVRVDNAQQPRVEVAKVEGEKNEATSSPFFFIIQPSTFTLGPICLKSVIECPEEARTGESTRLDNKKEWRRGRLVFLPLNLQKEVMRPPGEEKAVSAGKKTVLLPSSVFPSEMEAKVGLLNKTAPKGLQLDLDPEIVATFDDDYDFDDPENEFDDDFVLQLNGGAGDPTETDDMEMDDDFVDVSDDSDIENGHMMSDDEFEREETKSRFTEYSMTSSVIRRNEQLTILDNKFEKIFEEYDENEMGALDCEEIEGDLDPESDLLKQITEEFEKAQLVENFPFDKTAFRQCSDSDSDDSDCSLIEIKPKEKWDCESILSTYTDIYNHPKIISAPKPNRIKIDPRTGVPIADGKLTKSALSQLDATEGGNERKRTGPGSIASIVSTLSNRPKGETPEERASRKKAFKEFRKERRAERKCNKEAFKEEKKRMEKVVLNTNKGKHQIPL